MCHCLLGRKVVNNRLDFVEAQCEKVDGYIDEVRHEIERLMTLEERLVEGKQMWEDRRAEIVRAMGSAAVIPITAKPRLTLIQGGAT
jgi:hypothetical protein